MAVVPQSENNLGINPQNGLGINPQSGLGINPHVNLAVIPVPHFTQCVSLDSTSLVLLS